MANIDFWYSIGSTYSYLTVMRISEIEESVAHDIRWRPFDVRRIMIAQKNIPFRDKPVKTAYMWRDIERRAERYGLGPKVPAPYPLPGLELANRVALLGAEQGWGKDYARATYRRWFEGGEPAGEDPNLSASLSEVGLDPATVLEEARSDLTGSALVAQTEEAMQLGVFGSPSFVVSGEVFWGDDRLEDALLWADGL